MRFATLALALIPATAFAAPIPAPAPGFLDTIGGVIGDILDGGDGATLGGIVGAVKDSIKRPELLIARIKVVKGLGNTKGALDAIVGETDGTSNAVVGDAAKTALAGVAKAQGGVDEIGKAIVSGTAPERADQAVVAQGIIDAETAIKSLEAAIVTPDEKLSSDIKKAVSGVALLRAGGEGVLAASGLKFEDLGIGAEPPVDAEAPVADDAEAEAPVADDAEAEAPVADEEGAVDADPVEEVGADEEEAAADETPAAADNAQAVEAVRTPDLQLATAI